jgi:CrcB protein
VAVGTFLVNVVGSFARSAGGAADARGRCRARTGSGGFTTYSAFNLETIRLALSGAQGRAAGYVLATLIACLLAGLAGMALAKAMRGRG